MYPPDTPFNVERKCFEYLFLKDANFKYALSHSELFANYDDDNGYYGESCIKRGLYPFHNTISEIDSHSSSITFNIILKKGELYDATYVNQSHRIRKPPVIKFAVNKGVVLVNVGEEKFEIQSGQSKLFYSNKSPAVSAINYSEITIHIYDELLS